MKTKFWPIFDKISAGFLFVLIIFLPFLELILHALQSWTKLTESEVFWICHFYEPILILLIFVYLFKIIFGGYKKLINVDFAVLAVILISIISILVYRNDLTRSLEGARFLLLPYAVYLFARFSEYKNLKKLLNVYLWIAGFMAILAVVEYFFLPKSYFNEYFKIANFGYGQNSLITINQATALLAPNQLASFLIPAYFYLIYQFFAEDKKFFSNIKNYLLIAVSLAIFLTYSRSALVGLILATLGLFIYFGFQSRKKIATTIIVVILMLSLAIIYALMAGELPRDILTHGSSFTEHLTSTKNAFQTFISAPIPKIIFGFGIGTAGPAALKLGGIISENYYLQILIELGIVGFGVLAFATISIFKILWRGSKWLFFAYVALLINAFFLHIFADNPAMTVCVFVFIAAAINNKNLNIQDTSNKIQTNYNNQISNV